MTNVTTTSFRTFLRFAAGLLLSALLFPAVEAGVNAQDATFTATLSGAQAVPANASTAEGTVTAELEGTTLTLTGSFSGLRSDFDAEIAGGAHIHLAVAGSNGGIEIGLDATLAEDNRAGTFEAEDNTFSLTGDQVEALHARRFYVNIHTQEMPSGEIRGQLLPDGAGVHHAVLSGRAEVPANQTDGVGGAIVELRGDEIVVTGGFSGLDSDFNPDAAGGSHLHLAPIGENGGIEVDLTPTLSDDSRSGTFEASDNTISISGDQQQALVDGDLYVNVHTNDLPGGELRGQVLSPSHRVFEANLSGRNEVPAVATTGQGGVVAVLDEETGELRLAGNFRDLASAFNAEIAGGAHLHLAPVGENGGIDIELAATLDEEERAGMFERTDNTFSLTSDQIESLFDGRYYVNVHTEDVPSGELRGQLLPSTNEAPGPASVLAPDDGVSLTLGDSPGEVAVEWDAGTDANFNDLFYRWELSEDESFEAPFFSAATMETTLTLSHDSLRSVLMTAKFGAGQVDSVYHRVVTLDGAMQTPTDPLVLGFEMSLPTFPRGVKLVEVAQGLTSPVTLAEPPDESGRLFVVDQAGQIRIIHPNGELQQEPFLDLSDQIVELNAGFDERGLLGLAFHPEYTDNGRFFVYYSAPLRPEAPEGWNHTSHISEFSVSDANEDQADHDSEVILLQVDQPQFNHDGGTVLFGPEDGLLYISLGDGGGADDTGLGHVEDWYDFNEGGNGQNVEENLLGSILRIDVDGGDPYGIPTDNPFVGRSGLDEIYAYGFRNPYRFSFDMAGDHMMLVGDAGQNRWEEVSVVERGGNYGWNVYEGTHCFNAANPDVDAEDCPDTVGEGHPDEGAPLIGPVIEYANVNQGDGVGIVVVGGYIYRGSEIPDLEGRYVFGDYSASSGTPDGQLLVSSPAEDGLWPIQRLHNDDAADGELGHYLLGFGQDRSGELYVLATNEGGPTGTTGVVYRLEDSGPVTAEELPDPNARLTLDPAYPNPFTGETTLRVEADGAASSTVTVYDILGRQIATLIDANSQPHSYEVTWDGTDASGRHVPSGVYLIRVRHGDSIQTQSVTVVR